MELLTRIEFKNKVMERDEHKCVFCQLPAVDAHHIIERRLWPDGGYYLPNGAAVCGKHHLDCEQTLISVEEVRAAAGITSILLPPHLYTDEHYDKWGNIILPNGARLKGELFYDTSVQKALREGKVINNFTHLIKYPRTFHLPWSPGLHDDDRQMSSTLFLEGNDIVVTLKLDGENTTMYNHIHVPSIHARSIHGYDTHPSRDWMRAFHARIACDIPIDWRITVENMYAQHSISYVDLKTYAYGFAVWNNHNELLGWDESLEWFDLLGIEPVPVLYRGPWDETLLRNLWDPISDGNECEGYVVRAVGKIEYKEFKHKLGKFVRKDHVKTTKHWFRGQEVFPNKLIKNKTGFEKVDNRYQAD